MKCIIFFLTVLWCGIATAQSKGDKKIIVIFKDTANAFHRVGAYLMDQGYDIDKMDQAMGFINTGEKATSKYNASQKLRAVIKDSTMTITASWAFNAEVDFMGIKQTRTFNQNEYRGVKGSLFMIVWEDMMTMAKYFGDKISYSK